MASLSNNTLLRYCHFIALYFAQGIPEGMLAFGIPAWMAMNGKTPGQIASFAIAVGLPWSFKFIVAPLMDRYTYLPMGRKRPWVIVGQLGLILSCIYLAYVPDPLNNLNQMMLAGFLVSFFGAFQDVATDGMAVDIIPLNQQARANGFMWGSKTIGMSVSLALGSWLISKYNYTSAILALAAIIGLIMLMPLFTTERENEKLAPWSKGKASNETKTLQLDNWLTIFKSLFQVFTLRNSLMIAIILFISQGAFKYISTLLPIFTVKELGWTNVTYSQYYATAKLIGGITGMLLGGILIEWFGKKRMLNIYFIGLIILTSSFVFFKTYWANMYFIYSFMIVYNIIYTITSICLFAIAMQCCWKKVSASQFTLYMTIANLGQIALAAFIGPIKAQFDWQITIWAFAIMIAVVWVLLQFLKINKQIAKVAELERKDLDSNLFKMAAD
ncbi:MAG: MFS transporter [Bacteroidetes bacterium]|jgi:PAT family beta-lactamase induction signal transducer AmpG|nr:MFS transporter [Bacteroidota bacterium]MBK8329031.1 MFS transporter [Bacteroidota bacterium]MBK9301047.1 MFS transporter [Bacteroidota bacterium]MBK9480749.1 MFS transporter [Bacteroidota bacterium]